MNKKLTYVFIVILAAICLALYFDGSYAQKHSDEAPFASMPKEMIWRGPAAYVYWQTPQGKTEGYTRTKRAVIVNASTSVNLKPWASVYPDWVAVQRGRNSAPRFIPREQIVMLQSQSDKDEYNEEEEEHETLGEVQEASEASATDTESSVERE